jgi:hypothetical protein
MSNLAVAELRRKFSHVIVSPQERPALTCPGSPVRIPVGGLSELIGTPGHGKISMLLKFLRHHDNLLTAWIEPSLSILPSSFIEQGVALSRFTFINCGDEGIWTTLQVLRSSVFKVIVINLPDFSDKDLRRLQLQAQVSDTALILLSDSPRNIPGWMFSLRAEVKKGAVILHGRLG